MKKFNRKIIITCLMIAGSTGAAPRFLSTEHNIITNAKHVKINNEIKIQYDFEFINNSNDKVYAFTIGEKSLTNNEPSIKIPDAETLNIIFNSPKGWGGENKHMPESYENVWSWSTKNSLVDEIDAIQPRSTNKGFSVITSSKYPSIFNSFSSMDILGKGINTVAKIVKNDNISPTGLITATLVPITSNGKNIAYKISTLISIKDNYDPLPEIIFDSIQDITINTAVALVSPFSAGYTLNVQNDIKKGIYPTVITIPADAKVTKKYRIKYKITDASDNQTTVFTVVTIPKQ